MGIYIKLFNNGVANEESIKEIIELWNANVVETVDCELDDSDRKAIQEQIEQYIQSKYGVIFIAINENNKIIGYGMASVKKDMVYDAHYGQIDEVYVVSAYRRQKVAKRLVDDLMEWLKQQNISLVHVHVDLENEKALDFWEGIGLEKEFFILSNN